MKTRACFGALLLVLIVLTAGCGGSSTGKPPVEIVSLVNCYSFEGNANDSVGGNNGTPNGTVAYSSNCQVGFQSLDLTANSNDVVSSGHTFIELEDMTLPEDMTITLWVNPSGLPKKYVRIIDFADNGGATWGIWLNLYDEKGYMTFGNIVSGVRHFLSPNSGIKTPVGEWSHIALTMSADGAAIYVNGKQIASKNDADWTIAPSQLGELTSNFIGKSRWTDTDPAYKGYIDDFRIYNEVLSIEDIQKLAAQ